MAAVVVPTNKLCGSCLYLPAIDLEDGDERQCVVESNDLCWACWHKLTVTQLINYDLSESRLNRLRKISPYLKGLNAEGGL